MVTDAVHKAMQGNKRANTKPELLVRERLREAGLTGYRLQWKVPGRPDVAWPGKKVALFVNGCFWHRCPRCKLPLPKSNVDYWVMKFDRNVERDAENIRALEEQGWKTHVIWECQLKKGVVDETFAELLPVLAHELGKELASCGEKPAARGAAPSEAHRGRAEAGKPAGAAEEHAPAAACAPPTHEAHEGTPPHMRPCGSAAPAAGDEGDTKATHAHNA